ncbi:MAG: Hpt domain-containing protein [Bdellovibrionales bacterium]
MEPSLNDQPAIDLKNLREISGGDCALETQLFKSFLSSADEGLAGLKEAQQKDDAPLWRRHAHAMKGISLNLGANPLGDLCRKAQDNYRADSEEKVAMLTQIETELNKVQTQLNALISRAS